MSPEALPWPPEEMAHARMLTESGRPYLYLASTLLEDPVKRAAFEVAYASMRQVDDAVDLRSGQEPAAALRAGVAVWLGRVRAARAGRAQDSDLMQRSLQRLFQLFELPLEPWEAMARVLTEDVVRDGFETLEDFLGYAEGAAVGPARLFALLAAAEPVGDRYVPHEAAWSPAWAALGRFTYIVHGLRDLAEDLGGAMRGSALAPRSELARHGLSPGSLASANPQARRLWALEMAARARALQHGAGHPWNAPGLPSDAAFVLQFVVALYDRQLARIEERGGEVFDGGHRLGPGDVLAAAESVAGARTRVPARWRAILEGALAGGAAPRA